MKIHICIAKFYCMYLVSMYLHMMNIFLKLLDLNLAHTWSSVGHQVLCSLWAPGTAGPADQAGEAAAAACQVIQPVTNEHFLTGCHLQRPSASTTSTGITLTFQSSLLSLVNTFSLCLCILRLSSDISLMTASYIGIILALDL